MPRSTQTQTSLSVATWEQSQCYYSARFLLTWAALLIPEQVAQLWPLLEVAQRTQVPSEDWGRSLRGDAP